MRLIALGGYAGAGKDTVAQLVGWPVRHWADPVRRAALALDPYITSAGCPLSTVVHGYGWDDAKRRLPQVRQVLQRVGTEAGRDIHGPDCWVRLADLAPPACYADTRFRNEVDAVWAAGGHFVWVERPGVGPANAHSSEHSLHPVLADYVLRNDGTLEDLAWAVRAMLTTLEAIDYSEGW